MAERRFKGFFKVCQAVVLVFLFNGYSLADEVILMNGDRLSGKIVEISDGVLTLETVYSEPIKVKFEAVQQMSSSEPLELHLIDGEVLKGKITIKGDRQISVEEGTGREAVTVDLDNIEALNPPHATWKGNITVGGNRQDGNTDTMNISAGLLAVRRTENDRFLINFLYNRSEEDGRRTAENAYSQLKYDYFVRTKWYLYLNVDMLSDDFQDINSRTSVGPGIGYQVWEEENKALGLEAGVSYTTEDRDTGEDTDWWSARFAVNYRHRLFDRVSFIDQFVIYPSLDDTGEYTLRNEAGLVTEIAADFSLRLSNIWKRDSNPENDFDKDDLTWILGLQYSF